MTKNINAEGYWLGDKLFWDIWEKEDIKSPEKFLTVSDQDLKSWCYSNLTYPDNYPLVIRQLHVEAYFKAN